MTYSEKLEHPLWQKKRAKIYERDNYTCQLCGDVETNLHAHHLRYTGEPWEAPDEDIITYCKYCHKFVEVIKSVNKRVIVRKTIKYATKNENYITLFGILDFGDGGSFSIYIVNYCKLKKDFTDVINVPTAIIRKCNTELDIIKSISNGENPNS